MEKQPLIPKVLSWRRTNRQKLKDKILKWNKEDEILILAQNVCFSYFFKTTNLIKAGYVFRLCGLISSAHLEFMAFRKALATKNHCTWYNMTQKVSLSVRQGSVPEKFGLTNTKTQFWDPKY